MDIKTACILPMYLTFAIQFLLGLLYANASEWLMHRYLLHGLGKNRSSFWAYHLYEHHAVCRRHAMVDPGYRAMVLTAWNTQTKELLVLAVIVLLHVPVCFFFPAFTLAVYVTLALYYHKHRKAHLDPVWAKQHLRWHYEHHLGGHGPANWCVTWPWFDYLMGTRVKQR
ncbi:MAG: hypothetical protein NTV43_06600 [Methylococcales bacterium]|nr:hypothetical protein [Methylococcales bacterium]